jgi:tRNA pseudouridine32 synthase/23S rRNA pseudouridine746 synthase
MLSENPLFSLSSSPSWNSTAEPDYWYEGRCPRTGILLRLPRTPEVEAIARELMQKLASDLAFAREGKMYGVLLVKTPAGERKVLKAFSGLLNGSGTVSGWVPPIPGRDQVVLAEAHTLSSLEAIKQELIRLQELPERSHYATLSQEFDLRLQQLKQQHRQRQQERQQQREQLAQILADAELALRLEQLDDQSRRDGMEQRRLKRRRDEVLQPLQKLIDQADQRISELKQRRKILSRQLQEQMHASYWLTNFRGESLSLHQLSLQGALPTGTGDCCAPKLLHYAASQRLQPLAMAEFWWGSTQEDRVQGTFYGACAERCQPLMGFLLSGLEAPPPPEAPAIELPIIYQDGWLVVVDKPAGLLSVPGRYRDRQDSALSRLKWGLADGDALLPVHRLDQDTSGILLVARDRQSYRLLSQQFQQRQVRKVYEAVLAGVIELDKGTIQLPLWGDPRHRPYQKVDWRRGKPSTTHFRVLQREASLTRVEFVPVTGRSHQIRVHAREGLDVPILGDRLYGVSVGGDRLHLHARELHIHHPHTGQMLHFQTPTPF